MTDRPGAGSLMTAMLVALLALSGRWAPVVAQSAGEPRSSVEVLGERAGSGAFRPELEAAFAPVLPAVPGGVLFETRGSALAPAALSVLVPGAGQLLALHQRRGWAYLALEAVGLIVYADRRAAGARYRDRYRDLAWEEARLADGPRVDGDFDFY